MNLKVLGSGSSGNCYLLESDTELLIIELGISFKRVQKALNFNYDKVSGALVSHVHGDHFKGTEAALKAGINVYTGIETIELSELKSHRLKEIQDKKAIMIGGFKVLTFPLKHDVPTKGFIINHKDCGNICFITDTFFSPWKFANINNWILECNYSQEIIDGQGYGATKQFLRNRVLSSHLSLENCVELLKANDLSKTNNIVLTHLSSTNSNESVFKKTVEDATGKTVTIANKGVEIPFGLRPF